MRANCISRAILSVVLCWAMVFASRADQVEPSPLPSGPLVKRAPDFSQWEVVFSYSNDREGARSRGGGDLSRPKRVIVTKAKPLWHSAMVDAAGKVVEGWGDGKVCIVKEPGMPYPMVLSKSQENDRYEMSESPFVYCYDSIDFPEIEWVSSSTYVGVDKASSAFVFRENVEGGGAVWIDAHTRLPVRWQKGGESRQFVFHPSPTTSVTFPSDVAKILEQMARVRRRNNWAPGIN